MATGNVIIHVHDGHAFSSRIEKPKAIKLVLVHAIKKALLAEPWDAWIWLQHYDEKHIVAYITHDGKYVNSASVHQCIHDYFNQHYEDQEIDFSFDRIISTLSVDFTMFLKLNQYARTVYFREEISDAQLEVVPYNLSTYDLDLTTYTNFNMNRAYCSINQHTNAAYQYYKQYQIPQLCHCNVEKPALLFALSVSGFARISNLLQAALPAPCQISPWIRTKNTYTVMCLIP
jgi:hypothetical protein